MENKPIMDDFSYDQMEKQYEALCRQAGVEPTASNMVGFDVNRPACKLIIAKNKR